MAGAFFESVGSVCFGLEPREGRTDECCFSGLIAYDATVSFFLFVSGGP